MPHLKSFFETSSVVNIEVEGDEAGSSNPYSREFLTAIGRIAEAVSKQLDGLKDDGQPDRLELTYGLKALPGGGFSISLGSDGANFGVKMEWSGAPTQLPEVPELSDDLRPSI